MDQGQYGAAYRLDACNNIMYLHVLFTHLREKGFGHAVISSSPVTSQTLFYCGSTTKSLHCGSQCHFSWTTKSASHIFDWDTPVSSLIREDFVLSDAWATDHITLEDALSHRTGYPGHTMGINNSDPRECVRRLRHLPMSAEPRTTWQYSNYMFTAVGHVIETLTGQWLGDFFREMLWGPMGMSSTYLRREDAETAENILAAEYWWDSEAESYLEVPHLPDGRGREGAGMVISNVEDYAKYLRHMMSGVCSAVGLWPRKNKEASHLHARWYRIFVSIHRPTVLQSGLVWRSDQGPRIFGSTMGGSESMLARCGCFHLWALVWLC